MKSVTPPAAKPGRPAGDPARRVGEADESQAAVDALARLLVDDYLRAHPRRR